MGPQTFITNSQENSDIPPKRIQRMCMRVQKHDIEIMSRQARKGNVRGRCSVQSSSQDTVQRSLYIEHLQDIWRYQHDGIPTNFTINDVENSTDHWLSTRVDKYYYTWRMTEDEGEYTHGSAPILLCERWTFRPRWNLIQMDPLCHTKGIACRTQ